MKKYLFLSMLVINSGLFADVNFDTVYDNNLTSHPDYTWDEFYAKTKVDGKARFFCTYYESEFTTKYKYWVKVDKKLDKDVGIRFIEMYNDYGDEISNPKTFIVDEDSFSKFREVFSRRYSRKFPSEFPVTFYKVYTANKQSDLVFHNAPNGNVIPDTTAYTPVLYYTYASSSNIQGDQWVLLGVKSENIRAKKGSDYMLGWVQVKNNNVKESAVLWNSSIGLRPIVDSYSRLKPIAYIKDKNNTGYSSLINYISTGSYDMENIVVDEGALNGYTKRMSDKNGSINRWLPMYETIDEDEEQIIEIGIADDIADLRSDMSAVYNMEELQIILALDGSASMTYVWKNLPEVILGTIEKLVSGGLKNAAGNVITPKIKICYWQGNNEIKILNYDDWISDINGLNKYRSDIANFTPRATPQTRVPISRTIDMIMSHDNIQSTPTYILVVGDASDMHNPKINLVDDPTLQTYLEKTDAYLAVRGVRVNTAPDFYSLPRSQATSAGYLWLDAWDSYQEFENHFGYDANGNRLLLLDIDDLSNENLLNQQIQNLTSDVSDVIIDDINFLSDQLKSALRGMSTDNSGFSQQSSFAQSYLNSIKKNFTGSKLSGTFFQDAFILAQDENQKKFLHTDVRITEETLYDLMAYVGDFEYEPDVRAAKKLIRQTIALFFGEQVEFDDIDRDFLESTSLEDFWSLVLGNKDVAKFLAPQLFQHDFTFDKLIDQLEDDANLEQTLTDNALTMFNELQLYGDENYSEMVTIIDTDKNDVETYYWVSVNHLNLFKNINIK